MKETRFVTRRDFLIAGLGLVGSVALSYSTGQYFLETAPEIKGGILGASYKIGHRLRGSEFPPPTDVQQKDFVIVGGGISGLSAAWKLHKENVQDFFLLELESEIGGNAQSGRNEVSAYPWGAHYVPLLTEDSKSAHELFQDLGIITGTDAGRPVYNDYYLCSDPHERLYMYGQWQEGLVPQLGLSEQDREQYRSFFEAMEHFKILRGNDGLKAFAIPLEKSSQDPLFTDLDRESMSDYLQRNGWTSPYLKWYVNYCCRDDYGATSDHVSAWAGIHYFAARTGQAANADSQTVITWPEGNGWIVNALKQRLAKHLQTQSLVYSVEIVGHQVEILYYDLRRNISVKLLAKAAILATPRFVAQRLTRSTSDLSFLQYSPWMVANVTARALPSGSGVALAWDNMIFNSRLLGYVVATHQSLKRIQNETVLTYYWPLDHLPPSQAREEALTKSYNDWRDTVLEELLTIHPELKDRVTSLDVWLWGHGMIRPIPGYIWGQNRKSMQQSSPPLFYAHSDMSGISIFEEANYHGVKAAEQVMDHLQIPYTSSL